MIGRVARRIWAIAMRERYGAAERSQKLKYHVQTSGRSLHAQEMSFNDIRTTLQALLALAGPLQQPAHERLRRGGDDADRGVRAARGRDPADREPRARLTQEREPDPGLVRDRRSSPIAVEEAVLREFERIAERGGVLGAMETLYQRGKIQDESLHYESRSTPASCRSSA